MLRPAETVQKLLLSSPARYIAEYEEEDFVLTHAWGRAGARHDEASPLYRTYFMLSFATPALDKRAGVMIPNFSPTGDRFCALLAVLFGKRFDHHGAVEMSGSFEVPNLASAEEICDPRRPYHGAKLRVDYPVPLDLREVQRLEALIHIPAVNNKLAMAFNTAALFYGRALRTVGRDPEIAYLHLITACERLAEVAPLSGIELEAEVRTAFERIENELSGGDRVTRLFRGRMRQLRRRFAGLITTHLDDAFFKRSEADTSWGALRKDKFPKTALAAYDLRSRFIHTGLAFGNTIAPDYQNSETANGAPSDLDKESRNIFLRAPTFIGLERMTRLVLLKCAGELGMVVPEPDHTGSIEQEHRND
ncbi:MAG: hypothetical protein EON59_06580 [Alphaproteobacteria bacterium]|nr:MAG: hypothetical protein EON59_06580 [Alphaproteobacteria bacterium]